MNVMTSPTAVIARGSRPIAGTSIMTEQGVRWLGPGMAVTAEIRTGRRTVVSYLLSPLQRLRQKGLRER